LDLAIERVLERQLSDYITSGNVMALQKFFADATGGFAKVVAIANGEEVNGKLPSVQEILSANKIIIEKAFPSLKATHVIQQHVRHDDGDIDVSDLQKQLSELMVEVQEYDG
jgi:hypothetical protein